MDDCIRRRKFVIEIPAVVPSAARIHRTIILTVGSESGKSIRWGHPETDGTGIVDGLDHYIVVITGVIVVCRPIVIPIVNIRPRIALIIECAGMLDTILDGHIITTIGHKRTVKTSLRTRKGILTPELIKGVMTFFSVTGILRDGEHGRSTRTIFLLHLDQYAARRIIDGLHVLRDRKSVV